MIFTGVPGVLGIRLRAHGAKSHVSTPFTPLSVFLSFFLRICRNRRNAVISEYLCGLQLVHFYYVCLSNVISLGCTPFTPMTKKKREGGVNYCIG